MKNPSMEDQQEMLARKRARGEEGSVGRSLNVSGIPTPSEHAAGKAAGQVAEAERYAEHILDAVRAYFTRGCTGSLNPKLRDGGTMPDGALALANEALASREWRVEISYGPEGQLWTLKSIEAAR